MPIDFPQNPQENDTYTSGNTTWQWNGSVWNIVTAANPISIPNAFNTISVADQDNIVADATNDTLNFQAGSNITLTTDSSTDTITIESTASGGGDAVEQNLFETIAGDTGSSTATLSTDTFTIAGGANITTSVTGKILTVAYEGPAPVTVFSNLTDANSASLNISDVYLPAITKLIVDNVGQSSYTFDQYAGSNPSLFVISGTTIAFDLNSISGHPFELQDNTLTALTENLIHVSNSGVVSTDSAAQGKDSGVLYWKIPADASGTYVYQCQVHAAMVGNITVKTIAVI